MDSGGWVLSGGKKGGEVTAPRSEMQDRLNRLALLVEAGLLALARRWVWVLNAALFVYVALAILAPVFMALGWTRLGEAIYLLYMPFCHQLPERSYFLFGERFVYALADLQPWIGVHASLWARKLFVGNPQLGYKMAFCQRDLALYGSLWLAGMAYALSGRRWRPLSWKWFGLLLVPIALDGGTQLVMLRESTWWLRTITGALAGVGTVWALYPRLEESMASALRQTRQHSAADLATH